MCGPVLYCIVLYSGVLGRVVLLEERRERCAVARRKYVMLCYVTDAPLSHSASLESGRNAEESCYTLQYTEARPRGVLLTLKFVRE